MSDAETKSPRARALAAAVAAEPTAQAIKAAQRTPMRPEDQPTTAELLRMVTRGPILAHDAVPTVQLPRTPGRPIPQPTAAERNAVAAGHRAQMLDRFAEQIRDASETLPTLTVARVKRSRRASGIGTRDAIAKAARQLQTAEIPREHWVTAMLDGGVVYDGRRVKLDAPIDRDRRTVQKTLKALGF